MKRKTIFVTLVVVLLTGIFLDTYLRIEYDASIFEYLQKSHKLTEEERKWLEGHGSIIYGADQNAPPLRYVDEESKQYKGIVVDYLRALSIELGADIKFKPLIWEEALKSLAEGETDICDMYPSENREKLYLFSDPIYNQKAVILVSKEEKDIVNYVQLKDKTIAAQKGDYVVEFLNSEVSNIEYKLTIDYQNAIMLLKEGEVDAVVGDEPVISYFVEKLGLKDNFKILDRPIYEKESVLAVPKSEEILLEIINKGIYNLNRKNTMVKIYQKWFGVSAPFIKENISEKITLIISIFITIILLASYIFYSWNKLLKEEVEKRTEELNISRADLQTTFDGLTHLMIVLNKDFNIINVNKSFCRLIKRNKKEIIGKNCRDISNNIYVDDNLEIIKKTFIKGKSYQNEFEYKDRIFEMSTFPLEDKSKRIDRVLVMIKDITKVRISEQKLLQSNKMAAVGQLASGVAHEIRNPLGLIRNYSYILKMNKNKDEEKTKKAISVIESSVNKASDIIDNLLNFSRISSNKREEINIRDFIESIIKLEYKVMERQNIKVEVECDDSILCYLNQESLKHIFINLISNSIDAMINGGILKITCNKKDNDLLFTCSDTGSGIRKEDLENIFNPFFTTKVPGKGTGLGLYVTYNEVKKLGGEIRVSSEVGEGTTFYITLPLDGDDINEK
ncbi:transporter substrate-binding domain-containing protein [Oceanirhabdus sp. W0125-5]|uniref:transporter substrate-binding domain-containing protein n=1 Tax=Oceanirhabdus sp. W0125-5 TaxID=2999116 RepID=UPI0022F327C2|nr:transporter substrate-binding domain-containing protein [Oceanirhabdus sp. W0125-5]WBW97097.1 transporter substrate-binding domain-containing protein [Oceanirhabdus sp. W0125-5]